MSQQVQAELTDFNISYSDNFPGILAALNISLAVTSYQAGLLLLVRSDGEEIHTCSKDFPRPMGVYADAESLTLGTFTQVLNFRRSDGLLRQIKEGRMDNEKQFSKKVLEKDEGALKTLMSERQTVIDGVKQSDALYIHRAALTTGMINIHDIAWGDDGLWVVNSTFSCLATLSPEKSFVARWKPPFISELLPEDRCHLNGMALRDGRPRYVTTFNKEDRCDSWSEGGVTLDGTLINVDTNELLMEGLIMPHSPRYHDGYVYVCDSGRGVVWRVDPETKTSSEVIKLQGFVRGVAFHGDLMCVGLSKIRNGSAGQSLPLENEFNETFSGVWMISLKDDSIVAYIQFDDAVEQVYDIAVIPGSIHPEVLDHNNPLTRHLFDFAEEMI